MEKKSAVGTARLLRVLVYMAMAVNVICLPCVPFVALKLLFLGQGMELAYCLLLVLFFWVCGVCTLVILWQAKRILNTILMQEPFQMANAKAMHRAAVSCWIISLASLVRCVAEIAMLRDLAKLFTYNTFFVPCFFMAGLLFMVMETLFRQAADLREDQALTI